MSKVCLALLVVLLTFCFSWASVSNVAQLQPGSLCEREEKIVFSCSVGRSAKIVSLCSSKELTKDKGFMRYRFGLPGKIELEYPNEQKLANEAFKYSHYFRAQVDYTTVSFFTLDGYRYMVWDDYRADGKPVINEEGLTVTPPAGKATILKCRGRAKADYGDLPEAFPNHPDFPDQ